MTGKRQPQPLGRKVLTLMGLTCLAF